MFYKGRGEHSVNALEQMVEHLKEENLKLTLEKQELKVELDRTKKDWSKDAILKTQVIVELEKKLKG